MLEFHMVYPRFIKKSLDIALSDTPCVLLSGPRQCGKTTLIENWDKNTKYVTFDDLTTLNRAKIDPEGFINQLTIENPSGLSIIDELQHAPELLMPIKRAIDIARRPGMFLLTGSANLLSWSQTPDSLAGRIEYLNLYPLSPLEIKSKKRVWIDSLFEGDVNSQDNDEPTILTNYLVRGGFPEAFGRLDRSRQVKWFDAYIRSRLEKDVRDLQNIEKPILLLNLLKLVSYRSGSSVNLADLASKLQTTVITIKNYLALLQMLYLTCHLPAWNRNLGKRLVKSSKIYLIDVGLLSYLIQGAMDDSNTKGVLLEQFFFNELQRQISWSQQILTPYYFRTSDGREVDFIVENEKGKILGIEIKAKTTLTPKDWSTLQLLESDLRDDFVQGIVVYQGNKILSLSSKIKAIPIDWFV